MRKLIIILTLILLYASTFGQTFIGSTDKNPYIKGDQYNLALRINIDSTINFIFDRDYQSLYGEFNGRIVKLNDTLYRISSTLTFRQACMKSFNLDTFYIQLYKNIATQLDTIQFEYSDGKTRKQFKGYDSLYNPIMLLKIPVDKKLFNNEKGKDFITITINRKNFLIDNYLSFKIPYGSASIFEAGRQLDFNIVIKNGELYTIEEPKSLYGDFGLSHFRLKIKEK